MPSPRPAIPLIVLVLGLAASPGCARCVERGGQRTLAIQPGVVNDPSNRALRRDVLDFGLRQFCREMLNRGVPLRTAEDQPAMGRFFPGSCLSQDVEKNLLVQFGGRGYAWTNLTLRYSFEASGAVEYDQDFLLDGSTMYIYFRKRSVTASSFYPVLVERQGGHALFGSQPATEFGRRLLELEMSRGFTVIRDADGTVDFAPGILELGKRPFHPYEVRGDDRAVLANERVEVHTNQREFLGPFEVDDDGRALYITMHVDGAPAIDLFVMDRSMGEGWLQSFLRSVPLAPLPAPPLLDEAVSMGPEYRRVLAVPKGLYYLVLDHSAAAGRTAPAGATNEDHAALVNYVVQLGDAP